MPDGPAAITRTKGADPAAEADAAIRALERGLHDLERDAAQPDERTLAAWLAHEVRNAITPVIGRARMARRHPDDPSAALRVIEEVERLALRMDGVLGAVLSLADEPGRGTSDADAALHRAAELLRAGSGAGRRVAVACAPGLRLGIGPEALEQVLLNLFRNADEAMADRDGMIRVEARPAGTEGEILVRDEGPGVPRETAARPRRGMGLAVSRALVEAAGGRLELLTRAPEPAVFRVVLPLAA